MAGRWGSGTIGSHTCKNHDPRPNDPSGYTHARGILLEEAERRHSRKDHLPTQISYTVSARRAVDAFQLP